VDPAARLNDDQGTAKVTIPLLPEGRLTIRHRCRIVCVHDDDTRPLLVVVDQGPSSGARVASHDVT
jgi:hypothetical protein